MEGDDVLKTLRVVTGVKEVDYVQMLRQKLVETEASLPRLMRAFHFQQTMFRFAERCLQHVNAGREDDDLQYVVNIFGEQDEAHDQPSDMLFVSPPGGDTPEGFIEMCDTVIESIEELADLLDTRPELFDKFTSICFRWNLSDFLFEADTPSEGIVFVSYEAAE